MKKVRVALCSWTEIKNENYTYFVCSGTINIYSHRGDRRLVQIDTGMTDFFQSARILSIFGFELVQVSEIIEYDTEFLRFFKGKDVGLIKTENGYKFTRLCNELLEECDKEYLEEKYNIIINL